MRIKAMMNNTVAIFVLSFTLLIGVAFTPTVFAEEQFSLEEITVKELKQGYQDGDFTVEEVVAAYLEKIEQYENTYNAFTFMNEDALEQAKEMDQRIQSGEAEGELAGVPIVIKEAVDVAGFPSTFGWEGFSKANGGVEIMPEVDAPIVQELKEAGAIILGKTNIPAFSASGTNASSSWAGDTYNAVNPKFAPGGSSSGTATAISGNFAVLGIAEETGGSIQNPAAAQGIVGVKPTFGLVTSAGTTPLAANTRDVLGPHARTVEDAAAMLDVIAGQNDQDENTEQAVIPEEGYSSSLDASSLEGKRLGVYGDGWRDEELSKETQEMYDREIKELEAQGAEIVEDPFANSGFKEFVEESGNIGYDALVSDMQSYLDRMDLDGNMPTISEIFNQVEEVPWAEGGPLNHFKEERGINFEEDLKDPYEVPDQNEFEEVRNKYIEIIDQVMEENDLDGFVYPQMSQETPLLHDEEGSIEATTVSEINISGLPLVTVPAGYYESGSPFALAFFGKQWSEAELLAMAYDYEQATQHREAPALQEGEELPQTATNNLNYVMFGAMIIVVGVILLTSKRIAIRRAN
ncbi:amidase [Oceanobacillus kimchii]|uniref:amidase n=1 Tax=Oceanobacillus kimchii TaxID=746691 RepID=UPI00034B9C48|nr:amidase [Oceanobacillus kimchii]